MASGTVVRSVRDQITDSIRKDLYSGRFPAGMRLSEVKLAQRFGVSRGLIRESLAQLASEGLVVTKPNCGASVAPEPTNEIRDLIVPLRRTIEVYALKVFFAKHERPDFRPWEDILHWMNRACCDGDVEEIVLQDIAFHREIITRADQPDLLAIWQAILVRVRGHFQEAVRLHGDALLRIAEDHAQLLRAFRSGDQDAALKALEEHIW